MQGTPKVSILMPVRNEEQYLPAALASIRNQTMGEWELVAVDDRSTDATPAILADACAVDPRIRVVASPGGLVAALNAGLAECRADLVARMDGDDICHPERLARQVEACAHNPAIGLVSCCFQHFPRRSIKQGMLAYEAWQNGLADHDAIMRDLFVESPFVHPTVMMRRGILNELGGYRDCGWPEDYDLWLRMASAGVRFARLPEVLFYWRDHPTRATRTMDEYSLDSFRRCKAAHLVAGVLKGVEKVVIAGAGLEGRAWQRILAEYGISTAGWVDVDPRKIGRTLHGAPVFSTAGLSGLQHHVVVAIGVRGAREQFRTLASTAGLRDGQDFVCVS